MPISAACVNRPRPVVQVIAIDFVGQRSEALQVQFHQVSGGSVTEENQLESISLKEPESLEACLGWGVNGKLSSVVVLAS